MNSIHVLGAGTPTPTAERFGSSYVLTIENESIIINLKDPGSPVLIKDFSDKNSFYVVMPMKI